MEAFEGGEGLKIREWQDEVDSLADCNSVDMADGCMMPELALDFVDSKTFVIVIAMQVVSKQVNYKHCHCKDLDGIVIVTVAGTHVVVGGCNTLVVSIVWHTVFQLADSGVLPAIDSTLRREDKSPRA